MRDRTRFGLMAGGEPPIATASEIVKAGLRAEKEHYDSLWVPDHLIDIDGSRADPWTTLGHVSALTRDLTFYTAVTDYQKVHPSKLAQMVATLDELSGGRITLGIGTGERMNNSPFGVRWDEAHVRVEKLREYIGVIRGLWGAGPESPAYYPGRYFRLEGAWLDQKTRTGPMPRIHVGAMGSTMMMRLIGADADGWLPPLMTPAVYRGKLKIIEESARAAGREPSGIEHAYWLYVLAERSGAEDLRAEFIRSMKPVIATLSPAIVEAETGVKLPKMQEETNFQRLVVSKKVVKELELQAEAIPDSLVERMCAIGTPDDIIAGTEEAISAGANHVVFAPTRGDLEENLKVLTERVIPYFRAG